MAAPWQPFPSEVAWLRDDWMMGMYSQEAFDPEFGGVGAFSE